MSFTNHDYNVTTTELWTFSFLVKARQVFERAVDFYGEDHMEEKLFLAFGKFEESCKEV